MDRTKNKESRTNNALKIIIRLKEAPMEPKIVWFDFFYKHGTPMESKKHKDTGYSVAASL